MTARICARGHRVSGPNRNYRGDCLACNRMRAHGAEPLSGPRAKWNPYYADLPCPSCGSRATVPFDPRPERAGRGPSSGIGSCVACGHVFSTLAPSLPVASDDSPRPGTGRDGGGEPQELGVASAAAPTKDPAGASRRGPKRLQEQPQRAG